MTKISFTETAGKSIENLVKYANDHEVDQLVEYLESLIDITEEKLKANPLGYPKCRETSELGLNEYHNLIIDNYRIIYSYSSSSDTVFIELILHQRQSIERQLIRHCLMR